MEGLRKITRQGINKYNLRGAANISEMKKQSFPIRDETSQGIVLMSRNSQLQKKNFELKNMNVSQIPDYVFLSESNKPASRRNHSTAEGVRRYAYYSEIGGRVLAKIREFAMGANCAYRGATAQYEDVLIGAKKKICNTAADINAETD